MSVISYAVRIDDKKDVLKHIKYVLNNHFNWNDSVKGMEYWRDVSEKLEEEINSCNTENTNFITINGVKYKLVEFNNNVDNYKESK